MPEPALRIPLRCSISVVLPAPLGPRSYALTSVDVQTHAERAWWPSGYA